MKGSAIILFIVLHLTSTTEEDLYELMGIPRDATVRDIRKAFKILAAKFHPDKNKEDKDSESRFIILAKAYEILKNPETRNMYDLHGETFGKTSTTYQTYNYYTNYFGMYDDDPLIITLSRSEYEISVLDDNQAWFINFYASHCHHCQHLAPIWRNLAERLDGVIKVAVVNCEEDMGLCYQLGIDSYPTLLYYEKQTNLHEGEYYRNSRTLDELENFVLSKLDTNIQIITPIQWSENTFREKDWLLFLCSTDSSLCPEKKTQIKLSASLDGLVSVGIVLEEKLCQTILESFRSPVTVFWQNKHVPIVHMISSSDAKEILNTVLGFLPNPNEVTDQDFRNIRNKLGTNGETPWLLCFFVGAPTELSLQWKRLPIFIPNINIGLIHCAKYAALCTSLHVSRYPTWGILKQGGAFELHHGRNILNEVIAFAKDGVKSTNFHDLSPADIRNILQTGKPWFINWHAPWCPPCRNLMPEVRKASQQFSPNSIQFGIIDCTIHLNLCSNYGIKNYPTTIVYKTNKTYNFHGTPSQEGIIEFIKGVLNPQVISLDKDSFAHLLKKPVSEMWIINFYAPWCGPCQQFAPQWRSLANQLMAFKEIKVGDVDCASNTELCTSQNIRSYPAIRMYPLNSKGAETVMKYNDHRDLFSLKKWTISFLPNHVVTLTANDFEKEVLTKKFILPWLIDFYAPWCHGCLYFQPEFAIIGQSLDGKVRTANIDCEEEKDLCKQVKIVSYPTIILYMSPSEKYQIDSQNPDEIIQRVEKLLQYNFENFHDEL